MPDHNPREPSTTRNTSSLLYMAVDGGREGTAPSTTIGKWPLRRGGGFTIRVARNRGSSRPRASLAPTWRTQPGWIFAFRSALALSRGGCMLTAGGFTKRSEVWVGGEVRRRARARHFGLSAHGGRTIGSDLESASAGAGCPGVEEARDRRELIVESVASMAERCREGRIKRIAVALEADRDGFWLMRWLRARDIEVHVAWLQHRSGPWTDRIQGCGTIDPCPTAVPL
jgi:hypothetical protein